MLGIDVGVFQVADEFVPNPLAGQKRKAKPKKSAAEKPTILVVDDEQMIADTTVEILNKFGFRAVHAYDGQTALEIAAKLKPDYLLADVLMPLMNGVDLAIAITKILPATKILLFSGQAGISDILHQGKEKGYVFDLVAKPVHPEKLIERLKKK
jgi:CheY-like chemotaxis protein